jgi:dTDP-4-dehydrorhamnose 3,5-epimerase
MGPIDFECRTTRIEGLRIITLRQIADERGIVREFFRESVFSSLDPPGPERVAQVNLTATRRGAIRGLHGEPLTKIVGAASGEAFGAYVDARPSSPSFGCVETVALTVGTQVVVPEGVLNGFQSVGEDGCEYLYGFWPEWRPELTGIAVNALDPDLGIDWPIAIDPEDRSCLSAKDAALPLFAELAHP